MSIDHVVIGITRSDSGIFANCLERENLGAEETRIRLRNTPKNLLHLLDLVGCEIWGGGFFLYVGEIRIADCYADRGVTLYEWGLVESAIREWRAKRGGGVNRK